MQWWWLLPRKAKSAMVRMEYTLTVLRVFAAAGTRAPPAAPVPTQCDANEKKFETSVTFHVTKVEV